jgi:outer membrane protein OmpA-like peptidoglycan-associated protein
VTLYAHWQINNYTVTFVLNYPGNPGTPITEGCSLGSTLTALPTPTLSGYTFLGWFTAPSGGALVTSVGCSTVTLYAQWQINSSMYVVTFDPTGGSVTPNSESCSVGSLITFLPTPSRSNYLFDGWFTAPSGGSLVTSSYCFNGTLFAQWTASNNGGGTSPLPTPTVGISNLPSNPEQGSHFTPHYVTDGNGTVFTATSTTPSVCIVNSSSTLITFVAAGTCSLIVNVAATSTWNAGTGTVTTQSTNATPSNPHQSKLTVRQSGSGSVHSNVGSIVLHAPGTRSKNFNNGTKVILVATPKAGYVTHWSQACHGGTKTCSVTVSRATHVSVAFVPELILPAFYFPTNMSNITTSPTTVAAFKKDLVRLSNSHVKVLSVRGYADYRNGPAYNLALSQRRASSVAAFIDSLFTQLGIAPMRIMDLGLGILQISQNLQLDRKATVTF